MTKWQLLPGAASEKDQHLVRICLGGEDWWIRSGHVDEDGAARLDSFGSGVVLTTEEIDALHEMAHAQEAP